MDNTKKELIEKLLTNALIEIKNLKQHASKEELSRLDFESLEATTPTLCIYGQMTGNCFSPRAHELIEKCIPTQDSMFNDISINISIFRNNLSFKDRTTNTFTNKRYSPLEVIIHSFHNNNENIIDFLKGESDTIELTSE